MFKVDIVQTRWDNYVSIDTVSLSILKLYAKKKPKYFGFVYKVRTFGFVYKVRPVSSTKTCDIQFFNLIQT